MTFLVRELPGVNVTNVHFSRKWILLQDIFFSKKRPMDWMQEIFFKAY
jgi:hypothetical protein